MVIAFFFPFPTFLSSSTKVEVEQDPFVDENWEVPAAFLCLDNFENRS